MTFEEVDAALKGIKFMSTTQGRTVHDMIVANRLGRILELGFAHGKSSCYLGAAAEALGGDAHVTTMDLRSALDRQPNIHQLLEKCGLAHRVTPVFAQRSYTWELMKLLDQKEQPRFDFAYIDGGHVWDVTGFGFFLVDRLMAPGGWVLFDDLDWTIAGSPTVRDSPRMQSLSEEERTTPQVRKVFELLVRTHPGYVDVYERDGWGWARKKLEG